MTASPTARCVAAVIALCAGLGVAAGFSAVFGRTGSAPLAAWIMAGYFTNLTGLVVAFVFGGLALGRRGFAAPWLLGGTALATLLVGVVQRLLLHGLKVRQGGDLVADLLLHQALPILVPLFWLAFVPRGRLRWRDPPLWACYPLAYLALTLLRGAFGARYPYPFLDVGRLGWGPVLAYATGIAAAFLLVGWGMVALDRALAARGRDREADEALR
ncbi:Pr6Pr family membrane protein [Methylobacterium sp. Leaf118]|uniref:Pr6Pr family membrane protein n=1 Tax=Methylobacterium sp. Leaf118 TaxID=2876562 RepID=UPI001E564AF9|nr:Pr6Pr family membrane protein [Methylobacterium sp. Leaf118]